MTTFSVLLFFFLLSIPLSVLADGEQYSASIDPSVGVVIVVIVVLVCAFFATGCIATYIRGCADSQLTATAPSYGRFILPVVAANCRGSPGLKRSEIESFPTHLYSDVKDMKIGKRDLECAVCLTEFAAEDTVRLLPRCEHAFHPECIDIWLAVRSTCPVCRSDLESAANEIRELAMPTTRTVSEGVGSELSGDNEDQAAATSVEKPNLVAKFGRCNSTGHSLVVISGAEEEERLDRYMLRLPEEVRRKILVEAKMRRVKSYEALPRAMSSRKGYRSGNEGSDSRPGKLLQWTGLVRSAGDGEAAEGASSGPILVAILVG